MLEGDLAPTFSNLYPEILDPAGVSEQDFRTLIEKVNKELIKAFSPWEVRNWLDGIVGLLTGWVWDDIGATGMKGRLKTVEKYLEDWNVEMEKRVIREGEGDTANLKDDIRRKAPRVMSLRRTGYMNVSFSHLSELHLTICVLFSPERKGRILTVFFIARYPSPRPRNRISPPSISFG